MGAGAVGREEGEIYMIQIQYAWGKFSKMCKIKH